MGGKSGWWGMLANPSADQRAVSVARDSRTTVTLIWPGYVSSSSICLTMSRASTWAPMSSIASGATITRISRPACMANTLSTPSLLDAISSSRSSRFT